MYTYMYVHVCLYVCVCVPKELTLFRTCRSRSRIAPIRFDPFAL